NTATVSTAVTTTTTVTEVAKAEGDKPAEPASSAPEAGKTPDMAEVAKAVATEVQSATAEVLKAALSPLAEVVKGLEERLGVVERQPAGGGPLLSGAAHSDTNGFISVRGAEETSGEVAS